MGILDSLIFSESELLEQRQSKFMKLDSAFAQLDSAYKSLEQKYPRGIPDDIKQGQEAMRIMLDQGRKKLESKVAATPKTRGMLSFMKQEVPKLPETAKKAAGQAAEGLQDVAEGIPEPIKDYYGATYGKGVVEPVMSIAGGFQQAAAGLARNLDSWASWLSDKTGIPKDGILGENALQVAEGEFMALSDRFMKAGMSPDESGAASLLFHTYSGIGRAAFDLPVIMGTGLPGYSAMGGGAHAIQMGEDVFKGTLVGGIEGLLLHGVLKSARFLPQPEKMLFGAGIFGSPAAVQEMSKPPGERDYSFIVAEMLIGAGLLMGKTAGISRKQLVRDLKNQFGEDYNRLTEQFGKMADDKMLDEFARGRGRTIANLAQTPGGQNFVRFMRPFETFEQARWRYLHERINQRGAEDVLRKEVEAGRAAAEEQAQQESLAFRRKMASKKIGARVREKDQLEREQQYLSDLEKRAEFDEAYLKQVGKENARMNELDDLNIALMTKHQEFYDQMEMILKRAAIPKKVYEGAPELVKAGKPEFISEELGIERPTEEVLKTQGEIEEIMIRVNQVKKQYEGEVPIVGEGVKVAKEIRGDKGVDKKEEPEVQRKRGEEARREDLQRVEEAKRVEPAPLKTELVEEALKVSEESKGKLGDESLTGQGYQLGVKARTDKNLAERIERGINEVKEYVNATEGQESINAAQAGQYFREAKEAAEFTGSFKQAVEKGEVDQPTGKLKPKAESKPKEPEKLDIWKLNQEDYIKSTAKTPEEADRILKDDIVGSSKIKAKHAIAVRDAIFDQKPVPVEVGREIITKNPDIEIQLKEEIQVTEEPDKLHHLKQYLKSPGQERVEAQERLKEKRAARKAEGPIRAGFEGGAVYEKIGEKWKQIEDKGKPVDIEITDEISIKNIEKDIRPIRTKAEKDAIAEKMIKEAEKKKPGEPVIPDPDVKVSDKIKVGDLVKTNYGTGPYRVEEISEYKEPLYNASDPSEPIPYKYMTTSLVMSDPNAKRTKSGELPKNYDYYYINELIIKDGKIIDARGHDEVFVEPKDKPADQKLSEIEKAAHKLGLADFRKEVKRDKNVLRFRGEIIPLSDFEIKNLEDPIEVAHERLVVKAVRRGETVELPKEEKPTVRMGDSVLYKGERWEVGFVNQKEWKGTVRLQKSGKTDAKQINRVPIADLIPAGRKPTKKEVKVIEKEIKGFGKEPENIRQMIKSMGKVKSSDLAEHGISIKEDRNLFMQVGNKEGRPLDDLAQTLIKSKDNPEGVLPPTPKDMNPTDWLIENIRKNTKLGEEKITEKKYDKDFLDFQYREMDISTISKEKFAELMDKNKEPENISTDKLNKGDSFTIAGEKFKVTKETDDRMRIEDGKEYELDRQFDFITIDKGSLVKAGQKSIAEKVKERAAKIKVDGLKVLDKEPWEMTKGEYTEGKTYFETAKDEHAKAVSDALREGKSVSAKVLKDYPELKDQYEKQFAAKKAKEGIDLTKPGEQAQREAREKRIEEGEEDLFTQEQRSRQKKLFSSEGPDLVEESKPVYVNKEYPTSDLNQPITLRQIGERLSRDINYEETKDVRFGMIKRFSRKAKGLYFPDSGMIRVRNIRDIGTFAHEIGHHLDKGIFGIEAKFKYDKSDFVINSSFGIKDLKRREKRLAKLKEKYGDELVDSLFERYKLRQELKKLLTVTGYPTKTYSEAIAEFVKYYVKDPKFARDTAPKFNNLFESILDQDPNLRQALLTARDGFARYEKQPALQKMKASIAREDEHGRVLRAIKRFKDGFYVNFIDAMAPIEAIDKELLKRDPSISLIKRPLTQALSALGVDGKAEQFLNFRPFLKEGDEIRFLDIRPLIGNRNQKGIIYDIITKGLIEDFEGYLVANRNVVLHKRGLPGAATERLSESEKAVKEADSQWPWFKGLAKELQDYQDAPLQYYMRSGKLSQEQYNHMKELNPFYVPYQRYFAEYESSGNFPGVSRYLKDSAPSPVKRIGKESFREVVSPLGSAIKNTYDLISAADKNDALNSIVFALEKIDKRLVQDIPKRMVKPVMVFPKEGEGMELRYTVTYDKPKNAEIVSVWQDGEVHYKQIPKKYYDALFYNQQPLGRFVKVLAWPAKILRAGAVIFDPTFAVRNVPRDQLSGWFYSRYNYNPFHFVKGISEFTGKSDLYQKFLASGADQSFLTMIDKEMSKGYIEKKAGKKIQTKWQEYKSNPWIFFADINRASEMGTRMGSFRNAYQKTGNVYKAMEEARQISADYGIKGRWMRNVAAIYPFLNARTQHAKMINKSAIRRGAGSFIAKGLPLVAASTMQWLINNSDDRVRLLYNELPPWRRIGMYNFHIPYTDSFWSLPRGPLGLLFGATTEYALDKMAGYDAELIGNIAEEFFKDYLPMSNWTDIVPQAGRPLVEQYANKVGYTGRPIVRKKLEGLEPAEQYEEWTSEIMKSLGNALDIPPVRLQHLFVAYTAGTGRYILNISDDLLEVAGLIEPSGEDTFTKLSRWPITKAFISKPALGARGRSVHRFYETLDRIETVNRTVNNFLKDENVARADSYLRDEENDKAYKYYANPENRRSMGRFREVLRDAKFLRKEIIEGDYKNKREKMIALDEALTKTAIRFNNAYLDNKVFTVDEIMNEIRAIGRQARGEEKQIIRQFKTEFQSEKQLESAMSRMQLYKLRQKAGTLPAIDKYRMEALERKLKRYNEQTQ